MIIHDISVVTSPTFVTWDGTEQGYSLKRTAEVGPNSVCTLSVITEGAHTGTHLDAPLHFIVDGKTVDSLDVNVLVGPAQVVEVYDRAAITADDLEKAAIGSGTERLIFKTDNTKRKLLDDPQFHPEYVGIAPSAAQWLVDNGIRLVGVDYLSVGPYGEPNVETHRILLGASVVVVETLQLENVEPGHYFLVALPPKFHDVEGSPCRALLLEGLVTDA
jgi:arylformamidase